MTNYRNKFTVLTILLLLSLAVCGSLSAQNRADSKDVNTIRVSTAREFLEALGSNRTIVMEPGVYVLSDYDPSEQEGDEVSL
ncbi:MAG: hypothetical protein LBD23_02975, partial [Oscillospiraceae bacterium]|nr:hypothetical protein [Oscillospiraceae bacterium]